MRLPAGPTSWGALLMGARVQPPGWIGSDLSIEEFRRLVPHQNATTMQVAISVIAAVSWMIENPESGVVVPDDLPPHEYVLKISKPYLGRWISRSSDWTPLKHYSNAFANYNKPNLDRSDPWQFKQFPAQ